MMTSTTSGDGLRTGSSFFDEVASFKVNEEVIFCFFFLSLVLVKSGGFVRGDKFGSVAAGCVGGLSFPGDGGCSDAVASWVGIAGGDLLDPSFCA